MFYPEEIIFSATESCNLHCPHCFVPRNPQKLSIDDAMTFIDSCIEYSKKNNEAPAISKIGFSGGEPFLYFDFIVSITNHVIERELMFDQIMTNGDWWKDEDELSTKLEVLYEAGYDGKFGLSWDIFHGQKTERIITFIKNVIKVFGNDSINIQSVTPHPALFKKKKDYKDYIDKKAYKTQIKDMKKVIKEYNIPLYILPQSFPSNVDLAWQNKKWFIDDYCKGPGNILYIHPTGYIAPCCGFANEDKELFIGTIKDSYETVLENAKKNEMVTLCYNKGLSNYKDELIKYGESFNGKCADMCSFCDYICKKKESKK